MIRKYPYYGFLFCNNRFVVYFIKPRAGYFVSGNNNDFYTYYGADWNEDNFKKITNKQKIKQLDKKRILTLSL